MEAANEINASLEAFIGAIDGLLKRQGEVLPSYVFETLMRSLAAELIITAHGLETFLSPATNKLLDAMAEYLDA